MGGIGNEEGLGIAADASGHMLTTGYFTDTADFDPAAGTFNQTSAGNTDAFVSKLDSSGNFVFARALGGTSNEAGNGIAVDAAGNVLATGFFHGTAGFAAGSVATSLDSAGSSDVFVIKVDSSGEFFFAQTMGGTGEDQGLGLAVDAAGNVLTTGFFSGTADFAPGSGTANLISAGSTDIFVSKLDSSGAVVFAAAMGGTGADQGNGIALDAASNVLTTGSFSGTADFDPEAGKSNLTSAGSEDIFVTKLDGSGNFVFAKGMGGATGNERALGIAVDPASANVFTTGFFSGATADFDPGAGTFNLTNAASPNQDFFLSRLTIHSKVLWSQSGGRAIIWTVDGLGVFVSSVIYGPFSGFTATSYGSHRDGTGRLLWTDPTSGFSGLWKLDANDALVSATLYGPFIGFTAAAYAADPDGSGRIVWTDTSGAQYIWNVDTNGQFVSGLGYGVVPGFAIKSFVASP